MAARPGGQTNLPKQRPFSLPSAGVDYWAMKAPQLPTAFGVTNHEEQYSIWPLNRPVLPGWKFIGKQGTDLDCLAHIKTLPRPTRPVAAPNLLFELTEPELVTALARYAPDAPIARVREFLRPPFRIERFPNIAGEVGPTAAPKILASLWAQARRGVAPEALARHVAAEMERYSEAWEAEQAAAGVDLALQSPPVTLGGPVKCGPAIHADSGAFRIKLNTTRFWAILVSYGSVRVDHFKKNNNGKYKDEKAARLEVVGTAFVGIAGGPVQPVELAKVETNEKKCKAVFTYAGLADIPFAEGWGGVRSNSPVGACACPSLPTSMRACC